MVHIESTNWWKLIEDITGELESNGIIYSIDASSSLFVHGIEIEMDDLDIMVQWDYFYKSHKAFMKYNPTEIKFNRFVHYHFHVNNLKVHILGSEEINNLAEDSERVRIVRNGKSIWSKSIFFYRQFLNNKHPKSLKIDEFVSLNKSYIEELYKDSYLINNGTDAN